MLLICNAVTVWNDKTTEKLSYLGKRGLKLRKSLDFAKNNFQVKRGNISWLVNGVFRQDIENHHDFQSGLVCSLA